MKHLPWFSCLFLLSACTMSVEPTRYPEWYFACQDFAQAYEIAGCGYGRSQDAAKSKARKQIAEEIRVKVTSVVRDEARATEEEIYLKTEFSTVSETDVTLSELDEIKKINVDDWWFVALKFNTLPFTKRFARKLNLAFCPEGEKQNRYLSQTPLFEEINNEFQCKLDMRLISTHGEWSLFYGNVAQALAAEDFLKLLNTYRTPSHALTSLKSHYVAGEELSFQVKSDLPGMVSILNVYENGIVTLMSANQPIPAKKSIRFPSGGNKLITQTIDNKPTYDLYVAVFTDRPLDWSLFQQTGTEISKDDRAKRFAELLELMNRHEFSTVRIQTNPKPKSITAANSDPQS